MLVLCLSFGIAHGDQKPEGSGIVSGSVVDAVHAPIAGAYILLHGSGVSDVRATTDQNGRFSATVGPGIYDVFVASNGFAPNCGEVTVQKGKQAQHNATLKVSAFANADEFSPR